MSAPLRFARRARRRAPMRSVVVIQHVPHERLGRFGPVLAAAGLRWRTLHAWDPRAAWPRPDAVAGLITMGGPQSVCVRVPPPWLARERALLKAVATAGRPVLGVCLGAQVLAVALGGTVARNPQKEIGWYPVLREPGAEGDPLCAAFGRVETVFQWHGDAFTIPRGAVQLFSAPLCARQAFRYGPAAYGLQFHVEVTPAMVRAWLRQPDNARELAGLRGAVDPAAIRRQIPRHAARLRELARHVAETFVRLVAHPGHQAGDIRHRTSDLRGRKESTYARI